MTLPIVGAGQQLGDGNTTEPLKVGVTGGRVGFFGSTGTTQFASLTTVEYTAVATSVISAITSTQMVLLATNVNTLINDFRAAGLMVTPA